MEPSDPKTLLIGVQILLFCCLLMQLYRTKKQNQVLIKKIRQNGAQLRELTEQNNTLGERIRQLKDFQENLKQAELTTRFQYPRLTGAVLRAAPDCPERYRFIKSLDQQGIHSSEIATILQISTHEAEQLLKLSRIAKKN